MKNSITETVLYLATVIVVCFTFHGLLQAQSPTAAKSGYHLVNKIEIGGEGGWDYVFDDSDAHRLYVSHAARVIVIDTDSNKVVGEIAGLKGVHGIATNDAVWAADSSATAAIIQ